MAGTYSDLLYEMEARGFYEGAPSAGAAEIDAGVANKATCPECGFTGMHYKPFVSDTQEYTFYGFPKPKQYIAFAVCSECGHQEEF